MEKNYYEILQIDRNASPEIIEKAYKTLAKKYHPDLQDEAHKRESEEIFKVINEAYQTLSDPIKKQSYDSTLVSSSISEEKFDELYNENQILKDELNNLQKHYDTTNNTSSQNNFTNNYANNIPTDNLQERYKRNLEYEDQLKQARQKAYNDAYIQDLKNRGYKIRYKKTFSDYIKSLISIIIVLFILFILWHIPFIHNYFVKLYNDNFIIHYIYNSLSKIFN